MTAVSGFHWFPQQSPAVLRRGRPVTSPLHVPTPGPARAVSPWRNPRSRRRRPARDSRCACPSLLMISSIVSRASADRPARDIRAPDVPFSLSRCRRCRTRSSFRAAPRSAARRAFSCAPRRSSRHALLQVLWVFEVDAFGVYQPRHSQHRRRGVARLSFIPRRSSCPTTTAISPSRFRRRHGGQATGVDLPTAAGWISVRPPPKAQRLPPAAGGHLRGIPGPFNPRGTPQNRLDSAPSSSGPEPLMHENLHQPPSKTGPNSRAHVAHAKKKPRHSVRMPGPNSLVLP